MGLGSQQCATVSVLNGIVIAWAVWPASAWGDPWWCVPTRALHFGVRSAHLFISLSNCKRFCGMTAHI